MSCGAHQLVVQGSANYYNIHTPYASSVIPAGPDSFQFSLSVAGVRLSVRDFRGYCVAVAVVLQFCALALIFVALKANTTATSTVFVDNVNDPPTITSGASDSMMLAVGGSSIISARPAGNCLPFSFIYFRFWRFVLCAVASGMPTLDVDLFCFDRY